MKHRDQLLVSAVLGLVIGAAALSQRQPASDWEALVRSALAALSFGFSLLTLAGWLRSPGKTSPGRGPLLLAAASWSELSLWLESLLAVPLGFESPLRWLLAAALGWMAVPFAVVLLTRLSARIWR